MSDDCPNCAALLQQLIEEQRQRLDITGGVQSTLAFIDKELTEPTMQFKPPRNGPSRGPYLITSVQARLADAINVY